MKENFITDTLKGRISRNLNELHAKERQRRSGNFLLWEESENEFWFPQFRANRPYMRFFSQSLNFYVLPVHTPNYKPPFPRYKAPFPGCKAPFPGYKPPFPGYRPPFPGYKPPSDLLK